MDQHRFTTCTKRSRSRFAVFAWTALTGSAIANPSLGAQLAAYNTEQSRPAQVEDAASLPRYALAMHLAPAWTLGTSQTRWTITPALVYGLVPRTQVELEVPFGQFGPAGDNSLGIGGVRLASQYSLNVETRSLPQLAVQGGVLMPVGGSSLTRAHLSAKALMSRTFGWGRIHLNTETTFGDEPTPTNLAQGVLLSRWSTGIAADRAFSQSGWYFAAETYARQPLATSDVVWHAGVAARYLLTPSLALDAGLSRRLNDESLWTASLSLRRMFLIRNLLPGLGAWRGQ